MLTRKRFRSILPLVWFILIVGVLRLVGEPFWISILVGLAFAFACFGMLARAKTTGWLGNPGEELRPMQLRPLALAVTVALVAAALVYWAVAVAFG